MDLGAMDRRPSDGSGSDGLASKWWIWERWIGKQVMELAAMEALEVVVVVEEVVVVVVVVSLVVVVAE